MAMQPVLIIKLIVLLTIANGTPVLTKKLCGNRLSQPIDGGVIFFDRRPLFGPAKTIRGVLVSVALTTVAAPVLGLEATTGALVGSMAMVGDLFSSFVKRRLNVTPSSRITGLDQIPEALFPLLSCQVSLSLTALEILICVTVFSFGQIIFSPLLYRAGIRDRPF
jgi:CDP-2,3-bis-(O-geranylgeranyl)-sn-glycerol synthase